MGIHRRITAALLAAAFIFVTFAWDHEDVNRNLGGFNLYMLKRVYVNGELKVERYVLKGGIPSTDRQVRVYIPDDVAYRSGYVIRAYDVYGAESGDSNEVGLKPRKPGGVGIIPSRPSGTGLDR